LETLHWNLYSEGNHNIIGQLPATASAADTSAISYPCCHKYYIFFNNCDISEILLLHKIGGYGLKRLNNSEGMGDPGA